MNLISDICAVIQYNSMWLHHLLRLAKLLWLFSFLVFLTILFWTYALMAETLRVPLDNSGNVLFMQKEYYYYYITGLFILTNIFIIILKNTASQLPNDFLPVPNRVYWTSSKDLRQEINWRLKRLFSGVGFFMNLFLTWLAWWVYQVNTENPWNLNGITATTFVFMVSWLLLYVPIGKVKSAQ